MVIWTSLFPQPSSASGNTAVAQDISASSLALEPVSSQLALVSGWWYYYTSDKENPEDRVPQVMTRKQPKVTVFALPSREWLLVFSYRWLLARQTSWYTSPGHPSPMAFDSRRKPIWRMQWTALKNAALPFVYERGHQINQRNITNTDTTRSYWYLKYSTETLRVTTPNLDAIPEELQGKWTYHSAHQGHGYFPLIQKNSFFNNS